MQSLNADESVQSLAAEYANKLALASSRFRKGTFESLCQRKSFHCQAAREGINGGAAGRTVRCDQR
jgi:hypothetical protein